MDQAELDVALEELELRLERLRALYEQYFLGMEKIEPAVARKDVDRRIYVLRREKIRNTAKRFKLQTIIQRYNTFQQYWQRICREIENGTYKRHLLRAQKGELLTIAARRRLGRQARTDEPPADTNSEAQAPPEAEAAPAPAPAPEVAPAPAAPPAPAMPPTRPAGSPSLPPRLIPAAAIAAAAPSSAVPPARPASSSLAPKPAASAMPKPAASLAPRPATKLESLDLDMDFMGDWDPGASRAPARPASPPAKPLGATRVAPAAPAAPAAPPPTAAAARPGSMPPRPVTVPPRPAASSPPRPGIPTRAVPPPKPVQPARPAPAAALAPSKPLGSAPLARPAATPSLKPAAPAAAASSVDDQRMRDLHSRLQQAKQQTKEANVSYEGLAKSIRAAEAKLREQHKNRRIDFDVVIKDGKAVVKPIVR